MVNVGTGTAGTRYLKTNWPIDEGIEAGTTKLREKAYLEPQEEGVPESEHWGSL